MTLSGAGSAVAGNVATDFSGLTVLAGRSSWDNLADACQPNETGELIPEPEQLGGP